MFKLIQRFPNYHLRHHTPYSTMANPQRPIDLYQIPFSPPCRAVIMVADLIGVNLNLKFVNLHKGEHKKPEFLKLNPQHTVPVIDDNGFILHESRAILTYLVNKYGKDDSLYPRDPQKRALVDQALYFDIGTFYKPFMDYWFHCMLGSAPHDEELFQKRFVAMSLFDEMLQKSKYAAGDNFTLADISLLAEVSLFDIFGVDKDKYPHVVKWIAQCKQNVPNYEEINQKGVADFKKLWDRIKESKEKANL